MKSVTINDKEFNFVFNANTAELYAQLFGDDLIEMTMGIKQDNSFLLKRNRLQKLAYIANMQASHSIKELSNKLTMMGYLEWAEQFDAGTFVVGTEAMEAILAGWTESFATTATPKNLTAQQ